MIDRELQKKWEKRLQHHGLGIDQPMTDNSEGELEQASSMPSVRGDKHPDHARLRTMVDSNDSFITGGFEVKKVRSLEREIPEWALNDIELRKVLLAVFPKLSFTPPKEKKAKREYQRRIEKAGRWVRVIHLYYRMELPQQIVMKETGLTWLAMKGILRRANAAYRKRTLPHTP